MQLSPPLDFQNIFSQPRQRTAWVKRLVIQGLWVPLKSAGSIRLLAELAEEDLIFHWTGMVEYVPCYTATVEHWGLLPASRLASRKILAELTIKIRSGSAL